MQVLRIGQVAQEAEDEAEVRPDEDALFQAVTREAFRDRVGDRPHVTVQARGMSGRVPEEERRDDAGDHEEDEVRLADVRPLKPRRAHHLADHHSGGDAGEHEHDEEIGQPAEPRLVPEPRKLGVLVDRGDHRHHDRREEHEEAPKDERVHQSGHNALQQLLLAEHDLDLVLHAPRNVHRTIVRLRPQYLLGEELRATPGAAACDSDEQREDDGAYELRTLLSSALMAGTISCRSPITA